MEHENANVTGDVVPEYEAAQQMNKRNAAAALLTAIVVTALPGLILRGLWMEDGRSKNDFIIVFLIIIQLYLTLLCPALLVHTKPQLGRFDRRWFQWTRSELIRLPLLLLGALMVDVICALATAVGVLPPVTYGVPFVPSGGLHTFFGICPAADAAILSPIAEEIFWRGYAQSTLTILLGDWAAIFTQALLFGFLHLSDAPTIVHASLMGLVLGIWCSKRKTLLPVIIVHVLRNATVLLLSIWR